MRWTSSPIAEEVAALLLVGGEAALGVLHGPQLMAIAWQYEDRDEREELVEVAD